MKTITIKIDETKLSKNIPVEDVFDRIMSRIYEAIDYGAWLELLYEGEYGGGSLAASEAYGVAESVEAAVNITTTE